VALLVALAEASFKADQAIEIAWLETVDRSATQFGVSGLATYNGRYMEKAVAIEKNDKLYQRVKWGRR
jgi:chaperone required for assembly of F1-ATPase